MQKTREGERILRNHGLPWWLSSKEFACQCSRHGVESWIQKIPWKRKWQPTPYLEKPMTEEAGRLQSRVAKNWTRLSS